MPIIPLSWEQGMCNSGRKMFLTGLGISLPVWRASKVQIALAQAAWQD